MLLADAADEVVHGPFGDFMQGEQAAKVCGPSIRTAVAAFIVDYMHHYQRTLLCSAKPCGKIQRRFGLRREVNGGQYGLSMRIFHCLQFQIGLSCDNDSLSATCENIMTTVLNFFESSRCRPAGHACIGMFEIELVYDAIRQPDLGHEDLVDACPTHRRKKNGRGGHDHVGAIGPQVELADALIDIERGKSVIQRPELADAERLALLALR